MPQVTLSPVRLRPEAHRVVIRPFQIMPEQVPGQPPVKPVRAQRIADAVLAMDMRTCQAEVALVTQGFGARHWQTRRVFRERYDQVAAALHLEGEIPEIKKELIGAYFCHEYSYTSAALMNPSVVPHPDQSGLQEGAVRFVMSLRAVGEGHISSIAFREGIVTPDGHFDLLPQPPFSIAARATEAAAAENDFCTLAERFYEATLSGTVIFPVTDQQRNGLEDLRLVRMEDAEGPLWCGTYTAYSGRDIASEMMLTRDFKTFRLCAMSGSAARNKGMALFPRKVDGRYAMIGRQDGESLFYLTSDDLLAWDEGVKLMGPRHPWELVQMGNCGSPIELEEGWLLLTHGVGAMRQYAIGAALLDKDDPSKVLARSPLPLISPSDEDREGYVPNVVYTCGAMVVGRRLFVPHGVADSSVAFGWLELDEVLASLA